MIFPGNANTPIVPITSTRSENERSHGYDTIRGMLKFELARGGPPYRGSSACLYLNRTTQFVVLFLQRLLPTSSSSSSSAATYAYDAAFSRHHSWFVQKSAHMAVYLLPKREAFLNEIRVDGNLEVAKELAKNGLKIYEITNSFYKEFNLFHIAP